MEIDSNDTYLSFCLIIKNIFFTKKEGKKYTVSNLN